MLRCGSHIPAIDFGTRANPHPQEEELAANGKTTGTMFPEWDITKIWGEFKVPDFSDFKMPEFSNFKMPAMNVDVLVEAQQKNIEAFNLANKAAVEGWQAFAKKQVELWQAAIEETGAMAQDVVSAKEPTDKLAKQAAFAKTAFENGISNAREAQAMASKTANKTVDIVSKRWAEGIDEVMACVEKAAPKAAASK
jgi:phasin family protein